ncbi:hypothetical protein BT69DRAFT_1357459 [Atractiella rhizophila]|nr:hypothetical protein BT69DRAFT_1357459 [Atractiella rhizophila]
MITHRLTPSPFFTVLALISSVHIHPTSAEPLTISLNSPSFTSCLNTRSEFAAPAEQRLEISQFYATFDTGQTSPGDSGDGVPVGGLFGGILGNGKKDLLRLVGVGTVGAQSTGFSSETNFLSTFVVDSSVLSFQTFKNQSALCHSIREPGFTGSTDGGDALSGCPYGPGDIAVGVTIPLDYSYPLTTINSRFSVLDTSTPPLTLACWNVAVTPYYPHGYYYKLILWLPVSLVICYSILLISARVYAAYTSLLSERETFLAASDDVQQQADQGSKVGTVWWRAWSGFGLQDSGSLLRFETPGVLDIWGAVIWTWMLGTVAVNWPGFVYPILAQVSWSALLFNTSLPTDREKLQDPLVTSYNPPSGYVTQFNDPSSPIYIAPDVPNVLSNIGVDGSISTHGISNFAYAIGLRPEDLFPTAITFWLILVGAAIVLSIGGYVIRFVHQRVTKETRPNPSARWYEERTLGRVYHGCVQHGCSTIWIEFVGW